MKIQLSDHFTYGKLIRFSIPSIIMMIFTSIYGVVDGLCVSNLAGKIPFAGLNLIWPYIMALGSFGFLVGTGGTALISKTLGMGDRKKANEIFSLLTVTCIVCGVILTVLALIFLRPVAVMMGAEGEILDCAVLYGWIVLPAATAFILQFAFQSFCVAAEKAKLSLIMTVASGVCNMILDILLVPKFGLVGAAGATAFSQILGAAIPLVYFARPNDSLLRLVKFRLDWKALWRTFTNGSSELVSNLSLSIVGILYNLQLLAYAQENGLAAYGVIMYVNLIFLAIFIGFVIGTAPLIGFNYGADNRPELKNLFRKSMVIIGVTSVAMAGLAIVLARPLALIFVSYDEVLLDMTARGLTLYALSFLLCGFNIFGSNMFTALNNGLVSAIISFVRTLLCQVAAVLILPIFWGVDGIWLAITAAELAALIVTVVCFILFRKKYHYA